MKIGELFKRAQNLLPARGEPNARYTVSTSPKTLKAIEMAMAICGIEKKEDFHANAIVAYLTCIREVGHGRVVAFVDEEEKTYKVLQTPAFTHIAEKTPGLATSQMTKPDFPEFADLDLYDDKKPAAGDLTHPVQEPARRGFLTPWF